MKIQILNKTYTILFSFRSIKFMADHFGLKTFGEVIKKMTSFGTLGNELPLESISVLAVLILGGITEPEKPEINEVEDWIFLNMNELPAIMTAFQESFPKQEATEPKNVKRGQPKK